MKNVYPKWKGKLGVGWNFMSWCHPDMPIVKNYLKQMRALIQGGSMLFFCLAKGRHFYNKRNSKRQVCEGMHLN
jgi:hypothetical protein